MAKQWYFVKDGQQHGPISSIELKRKADSGEIGPDAAVRPEDRQNWVKAAAVKGLFIAKAMPASPLPAHVSTPSPPPSSPLASGGRARPLGSTAAQPPSMAVQPAVLRQNIEGLRQSIVQHVLNQSSGLPAIEPITTFRKGHADQQERLTQLRSRLQELDRAKAEYEALDNTCQQKAKELAAAEANFKQYARPLGKAAFEGVVLGQVQNQKIFNERFALQGRIGELQAEHDRLSPSSDAGMLQKTKAKAQQLVVVGKIKLEETKIGKLEEQIGKQLIATAQD
jgi:hypothetical protein